MWKLNSTRSGYTRIMPDGVTEQIYTVEEFADYVNDLMRISEGFFEIIENTQSVLCSFLELDSQLATFKDIEIAVKNLKSGEPLHLGIDQNKVIST